MTVRHRAPDGRKPALRAHVASRLCNRCEGRSVFMIVKKMRALAATTGLIAVALLTSACGHHVTTHHTVVHHHVVVHHYHH
jgi:hypothetical protein